MIELGREGAAIAIMQDDTRRGLLLVSPPAIYALLMLAAPMAAVLLFSFWSQDFLTIDRTFTISPRHLDDGSVEMDSNVVERSIRPIALNRKNALFAGHDEGGRSWGRIASLIETCKLNGVEPYAYLKATLEAIAQGHPASRIDELMPWNFQKSA